MKELQDELQRVNGDIIKRLSTMYESGASIKQLAKVSGMSTYKLRLRLIEAGVKMGPRAQRPNGPILVNLTTNRDITLEEATILYQRSPKAEDQEEYPNAKFGFHCGVGYLVDYYDVDDQKVYTVWRKDEDRH